MEGLGFRKLFDKQKIDACVTTIKDEIDRLRSAFMYNESLKASSPVSVVDDD
jgi:hypothetical protein